MNWKVSTFKKCDCGDLGIVKSGRMKESKTKFYRNQLLDIIHKHFLFYVASCFLYTDSLRVLKICWFGLTGWFFHLLDSVNDFFDQILLK